MTRTWMALGLLGFVAGCSGAIAPPITGDGGTDGATSDSGPDVAVTCQSKTLGQSIYGSCFDSIHVVEEQGGFGPPPPQGSECSFPGSVYDLKLATGVETADVCLDPGGQQPYVRTQGTRTLLPAQLADVVTALKNVKVVSSNGCMSDGPTLTLTVGAQGVDTVFGDSKVSACAGTPVEGIDAVLATLRVK
jgi:hypothetical protein